MNIIKRVLSLFDMTNTITKQEVTGYEHASGYIVQLKIPKGSRTNLGREGVVNPNHARFRSSDALVMKIYKKDTNEYVESVLADHDQRFRYTVGKDMKPTEKYDTDPNHVRRYGIDFFLTEEAAHTHANPIFHGLYRQWHDNGHLEWIGMKQNGRRHGKWKRYHPNGKLHLLHNYVQGNKSGLCKEWDEDGFLRRIEFYGECSIISIFYLKDGHGMSVELDSSIEESYLPQVFWRGTVLSLEDKMNHEKQLLTSGKLVLSPDYVRKQ